MKIILTDGLPCVTASIAYRRNRLELNRVILDTGSSGSIFSADRLMEIGLNAEPEDEIHRVRGVGGSEFVFKKTVDCVSMGEIRIENCEIEVGAMDYGFDINGIIGMDLLTRIGAIIDLSRLEVVAAGEKNGNDGPVELAERI